MLEENKLNLSIKKLKLYTDVKLKDDLINKELFNYSIMKICLRATDYNYEEAFKLGLNYFNRLNNEIQFESEDKLYEFLNSSIVKVFCNKGSNGETILLLSLSNWDPEVFDSEIIPCSIAIILDYLIRFQIIQSKGFIFLLDLNNLKFKQWTNINKKLILKILDSLENSTPIKINQIILLNKNNFGFLVSKMFKKYMKKSLHDKLLVSSKLKDNKLLESINLALAFNSNKEIEFLNMSNLIEHALEYMPGYCFKGKTIYVILY